MGPSKNNSIQKNIKSAINYLNAAYQSGGIAYPRVDNTFIVKGSGFDLFPHPPFKSNGFIQPFKKKKKITVRKEEIILFLSSIRIITPRHIEDVYAYVDHYLDDELLPYNEKGKEEIEHVIRTLDNFVKKHNLKDSGVIGLKNELYQSSFKAGEDGFLFVQDNIFFVSPGDKNRVKCGALIRERNKKESSALKHGRIKRANSIREALDYFTEQEEDFDITQSQTIINKN